MKTTVISFDGTERSEVDLNRPDRYRALDALLSQHPVAIRGSGLSYCLASAASGASTLSTVAFNRILDFDAVARTIRVEAGITVGDLLRFAVAHDLYVPVLPGHPAISVGGCVACNIHGKTQRGVGNFGEHLTSLTLIHPDHGTIVCGPHECAEIFELTVGGFGLTGYIADVTLALAPLPGAAVVRDVGSTTSLQETVEVMRRTDPAAPVYSWNDLQRRGRGFGSGVVYQERFEASPQPPSDVRYRSLSSRRLPLPFPAFNRTTTAALNRVYRRWEARRPATTLPVLAAAFPINSKTTYFDLFGRSGFREYQLIVPDEAWDPVPQEIARMIQRAKACVTLGSIKLFSGARNLLWFQADGVCVTVNGPNNAGTIALFEALDALAISLGVPVNLAKDSRIDAATVRQVFPGYEEFAQRLTAFDPKRRFDSALRRRIEV